MEIKFARMVTKKDLEDFKVEIVSEIFGMMKSRLQQEKILFSAKELLVFLGIKKSKLTLMMSNGDIVYTKIKGSNYFLYEDVLIYLKKNRIDKSAEIKRFERRHKFDL